MSNTPLELSLAELKQLARRRSNWSPSTSARATAAAFRAARRRRPAGNGAMGNARWTGVPLKEVLDKAGVRRRGQVAFNGLDDRRCGDARFRQGARCRSCARRRGHAGMADERRGPADAQRLSAAPGRARLLRHLLGQALSRNPGDRQGVRRLLDEDRLPHSGQQLRLRRARTAPAARASRSTASTYVRSSPASATARA